MRLIRVGAANVNQTPLDWAGNLARILGAIEMARSSKVTVLCLPELCVTGYGCEDAFFSTDVTRRAIESLRKIAAATEGMIVSVGLPLRFRNSLLNLRCLPEVAFWCRLRHSLKWTAANSWRAGYDGQLNGADAKQVSRLQHCIVKRPAVEVRPG